MFIRPQLGVGGVSGGGPLLSAKSPVSEWVVIVMEALEKGDDGDHLSSLTAPFFKMGGEERR